MFVAFEASFQHRHFSCKQQEVVAKLIFFGFAAVAE
jgi:hypothetical protein